MSYFAIEVLSFFHICFCNLEGFQDFRCNWKSSPVKNKQGSSTYCHHCSIPVINHIQYPGQHQLDCQPLQIQAAPPLSNCVQSEWLHKLRKESTSWLCVWACYFRASSPRYLRRWGFSTLFTWSPFCAELRISVSLHEKKQWERTGLHWYKSKIACLFS